MNYLLRDLLSGLIDYAGLFPPAALDMASAVNRYAAYREGETGWILGRFIAPVARLDEFEKAAVNHLRQGGEPWLLSALGGGDLKSDLEEIVGFNERNSGRAVIDTIEIKAERAIDVERAMEMMPATLTPYFEIPIAHDPADLIKIIAALGARAKARTGGVTAESFPSSLKLASFIKVCADEDAPFKTTAGLHHPLRSVNRLTYEPDSESALMHGFLNVFLAAAFAQNGISVERLVELLEERSLEAFQFDSGGVTWRGELVVRGQLRNARSLLAVAFGSCSFEEPVEELRELGLL